MQRRQVNEGDSAPSAIWREVCCASRAVAPGFHRLCRLPQWWDQLWTLVPADGARAHRLSAWRLGSVSFPWWRQPDPREPAPRTSVSVVWFPRVPLIALGPRASLSVRPSAVFPILPSRCSPGGLPALTGVPWSPPDGTGQMRQRRTRGAQMWCANHGFNRPLFSCSWKHFVSRP